MKMTLESAREILNGSPINNTGNWCKAEGYLEREEQEREKIKDYEEALKFISEYEPYSCDCLYNDCSCDFNSLQFKAKEILEKHKGRHENNRRRGEANNDCLRP